MEHTVPPPAAPPSHENPRRRRWRREYAALTAAVLVVACLSLLLFVIDWDVTTLRRYGYTGVFVANFIGAAGMVLPVPGFAAVFGGGGFLHPVLGVPTPVAIGLVAGLGEALGEFTGYLAGYGSRAAFAQRAVYRRLERWMRDYGTLTLFAVSAVPNPVFDVAGALAGAARMSVRRFFITVLLGKSIKATYIAAAGMVGIELVERFLG